VGGFFGIIDMRGFPRAQHYGDNGLSFTLGLSTHPKFIPKELNIPFSQNTSLREALELFIFWDWAHAIKKNPIAKRSVLPMLHFIRSKFYFTNSITLPTLLNSRSRYYADFMPVYHSVTKGSKVANCNNNK